MSNIVPISRDEERLEAASRWVVKIDAGLDAVETAALDAWLDEDERNRELLVEVAAVWDKTDTLVRLAALFPHETEAARMPHAGWFKQWLPNFATAAVLVMLAIGSLTYIDERDVRSMLTTTGDYATAIGEQKTVLLPDGSEVDLNTNSRLSVTFTPSERVLRLSQGEIFLRVAKDPDRPLSVLAGDKIIQAVGTEFLVEINDGQRVGLLVTEGKVVIGIQPPDLSGEMPVREAAFSPLLLAQLEGPEGNIVTAGEAVVLTESEPMRSKVSADEIEVKLSWKEGRLIFRSEPLENALREVERYTTVEFVFLDESLRSRTLSGRFRAGDVEALLLSLRVNFDIVHEFDSESRVLLSSR